MPAYPVEFDTVNTDIRELASIQGFLNFGDGRTAQYHLEVLVRILTKYLDVVDPNPMQHQAKEAGKMDLSTNLARTRRSRSRPVTTSEVAACSPTPRLGLAQPSLGQSARHAA